MREFIKPAGVWFIAAGDFAKGAKEASGAR